MRTSTLTKADRGGSADSKRQVLFLCTATRTKEDEDRPPPRLPVPGTAPFAKATLARNR